MSISKLFSTLIAIIALSYYGRGLYVRMTDKDHIAYKTEAARRVLYDEGLSISETTITAMLSLMSSRSDDPVVIDKRNYYRTLIYAESGSGEDQYQLGLMYLNGLGTVADRQRAIEWMESSFYGSM